MWKSGSTKTFALLLVLSALSPASIQGADWPQWRGPNRDGVWNETGLMETFPAAGLKSRWRAPVGRGWSSPVVARGRVFVTDAELKDRTVRERVLCFDAETGRPLWTYAYDEAYPAWTFNAGQEQGPSATPIVDGRKVYTVGANGQVHCFDTEKGTLLWNSNLRKDYEIEDLMCRSSPLIDGDLLIVFTGAKPGACVMALDKHTGKMVWKALDESVANSSPILITAGGKRQLIVWTQQSVTSLAPADGATFWQERLKTTGDHAVATPIVHDNLLLIGGLMLELSPDKPAASVIWPQSRAAFRRVLSRVSTATVRGDYVYSAKSDGELACLEAKTGKQLWEVDTVTRLKSGGSIHITDCGDSALLFTDEGMLIRARLVPEGYKEICRSRLLEPTYPFGSLKVAWTPPAYANRHVFARSDQELVCVSLADAE